MRAASQHDPRESLPEPRRCDQLAEQVRSTNQRYEKLFDAVPVQVVVLDRQHNITAVNRKFKELFGDQVGKKFYELFNAGSLSRFS